ncbi:MAG: hypothetical protein Aurels2KO_03720 [Aureliella sp.]
MKATDMKNMPAWIQLFNKDENGGAYTLSYVMVIPFLLLLVALTVESALMMSAKIGTVYSAYAAARSASVYSTGRPWGETTDVAERAARQAMLPFASGSTPSGNSASGDDEIIAAYEDWADDGVTSGYLRAKASDVVQRLSLKIEPQPAEWDSQLRAVVTYEFPFHVPGIGQLLGTKGADGVYVFPLQTEAVIGNDGPQNTNQDLGIGYGSNQ